MHGKVDQDQNCPNIHVFYYYYFISYIFYLYISLESISHPSLLEQRADGGPGY